MGLKKILNQIKNKIDNFSDEWHEDFIRRVEERHKRELSSDEVYKIAKRVNYWNDAHDYLKNSFEIEGYRGRVNEFRINVIKSNHAIFFRDIVYRVDVFSEDNMEIGAVYGSSYDKKRRKEIKELFLDAKQQYAGRLKEEKSKRNYLIDLKRLENVDSVRKLLE